MSDEPNIKIVKLSQREDRPRENKDLVQMLSTWLDRAKSGEITSAAICGCREQGNTAYGISYTDSSDEDIRLLGTSVVLQEAIRSRLVT